jgi:uncharacterized phage-associated protein
MWGAEATNLATWLLRSSSAKLTHLKLQKLCFYGYGALLASDLEKNVGVISFEAWAHGPVNRAVWEQYRSHGRNELPVPDSAPRYSERVEQTLNDVLDVYGLMDAWSLREESHHEAPWKETWSARQQFIDQERLKAHFRRKFAEGRVRVPAHLLHRASFTVDGLPVQAFESLHVLASQIRYVRQALAAQ